METLSNPCRWRTAAFPPPLKIDQSSPLAAVGAHTIISKLGGGVRLAGPLNPDAENNPPGNPW